jgi:hypothetical protein
LAIVPPRLSAVKSFTAFAAGQEYGARISRCEATHAGRFHRQLAPAPRRTQRPIARRVHVAFVHELARAFVAAVRLSSDIQPLGPGAQRDVALAWLRVASRER